jgi:hypothetical protein
MNAFILPIVEGKEVSVDSQEAGFKCDCLKSRILP